MMNHGEWMSGGVWIWPIGLMLVSSSHSSAAPTKGGCTPPARAPAATLRQKLSTIAQSLSFGHGNH
jgi:hypothetical protein